GSRSTRQSGVCCGQPRNFPGHGADTPRAILRENSAVNPAVKTRTQALARVRGEQSLYFTLSHR
ncbi:MAG TPA: hypothetical protein VHA06_10405, partial [Candidatus Angelobacter sp.]|nr:hypothetical protein [Candidatus Angelobacter sp.]